jgi:hypothetical protein
VGKLTSHTDAASPWSGAVLHSTRTPVDIDLVTLVVWGTAARIFVPDLRHAGRRMLAAAVRVGAHHLRQQSTDAISPASPTLCTFTHEGEAR